MLERKNILVNQSLMIKLTNRVLEYVKDIVDDKDLKISMIFVFETYSEGYKFSKEKYNKIFQAASYSPFGGKNTGKYILGEAKKECEDLIEELLFTIKSSENLGAWSKNTIEIPTSLLRDHFIGLLEKKIEILNHFLKKCKSESIPAYVKPLIDSGKVSPADGRTVLTSLPDVIRALRGNGIDPLPKELIHGWFLKKMENSLHCKQ